MLPPSACPPWSTDKRQPSLSKVVASQCSYTTPRDAIGEAVLLDKKAAKLDLTAERSMLECMQSRLQNSWWLQVCSL